MKLLIDRLRRVIYSCMFMTYGPRRRYRKGGASQPGSSIARAVRSSARRCREDGTRLQGISASGISLSATGTTVEATRGGGRSQSGLHSQAISNVGGTCTVSRQRVRTFAERDCESGSDSAAGAETRAWLSAAQADLARFIWNIDLIDCCLANWSRLTSYWCPIGVDRLSLSHPRLRRRI
jgi:hypothetical protein